MHGIGRNRFLWPMLDDVLWYSQSQIVTLLDMPPERVTSRHKKLRTQYGHWFKVYSTKCSISGSTLFNISSSFILFMFYVLDLILEPIRINDFMLQHMHLVTFRFVLEGNLALLMCVVLRDIFCTDLCRILMIVKCYFSSIICNLITYHYDVVITVTNYHYRYSSIYAIS